MRIEKKWCGLFFLLPMCVALVACGNPQWVNDVELGEKNEDPEGGWLDWSEWLDEEKALGEVVGEEEWRNNPLTSSLPMPDGITMVKTELDAQYDGKVFSVTTYGFDIQQAEAYIGRLEDSGVKTEYFDVYDKIEYPILNYMGAAGDGILTVTMSVSGNGGGICVSSLP